MKSTRVRVGSHGWIELVDVMGSDARIVDAARISYGNEEREGRTIHNDRNLIRYMMRHTHTRLRSSRPR